MDVHLDKFKSHCSLAGCLGIAQSLTWISLSITGILAHNCVINLSNLGNNLADYLRIVFFKMYFDDSCKNVTSDVDITVLKTLNLSSPNSIYVWMWIYLVLNIVWLMTSGALLAGANNKPKTLKISIYFWILNTILISVLDSAIGIIFGIDYDTILNKMAGITIVDATKNHLILTNGLTVSAIMMVVALKGFIFVLVNVGVSSLLFISSFHLSESNETLLQTQPALSEEKGKPYDGFGGYGINSPRPPRRPIPSVTEPLKRPKSEVLRNGENSEIIARRNIFSNVAKEINLRNSSFNRQTNSNITENRIPAPDYSPPMPRRNPFENNNTRPQSHMKNSRF